jgi:hypothetical protein
LLHWLTVGWLTVWRLAHARNLIEGRQRLLHSYRRRHWSFLAPSWCRA